MDIIKRTVSYFNMKGVKFYLVSYAISQKAHEEERCRADYDW